ncbi:MAG: hypothetical protein KGO53_11435 [Alphaproteobacteria bacterium]|nr:hypothetical protein [Alphaproteobacteria bacterium]
MHAAGPIRSEHSYSEGGVVQTKTVDDFAPPDQLQETAESPQVGRTITVLVSGQAAWSIVKSRDGSQDPPRSFSGQAYLDSASQYGLPRDPATACKTEGSELHLTWKADNGKQFQEIVARADAQTHILIAIDGAIKRKDGTVESEDHTTFKSIAAFTVTPPKAP